MGMASRDLDFDEWYSHIKSNDTPGGEFCLSALCQAFQCHAIVVTSTKIWTMIPTMYDKSDAEIRWLCDVHFLFMCKDMYTCLTPKFEWKKDW